MSEGRAIVSEASLLGFAPGVRLRFDKRRDAWLMMAPERVLVLDEIGAEILRATLEPPVAVGKAIDHLAQEFDAPREEITSDVIELLQDFTDKRFVTA